MGEERDKLDVLGQMAGIIAMISALVKTLPPSTRKRLLRNTQAEFESLLAAMSTGSASGAYVERESVEWMRDLFLKRIDQADSKQSSRRVSKAAANAKPSTNIDFEL